MTAKEKADELVNKYLSVQFGDFPTTDARQCALIAVDEIMQELDPESWGLEMNTAYDKITYWHLVIEEIEKL